MSSSILELVITSRYSIVSVNIDINLGSYLIYIINRRILKSLSMKIVINTES